jgi:cytochrome c biogenesis protein
MWVRITSGGVEVAGLAKNSAPGLDVEIEKFVSAIRGEK